MIFSSFFKDVHFILLLYTLSNLLVLLEGKKGLNIAKISANISTHACLKTHKKEVKECVDEFKDVVAEGFNDTNRKEICCTIYGFKKCVSCVILESCANESKNVSSQFDSILVENLGTECEKYFSAFKCLSSVVLYCSIGLFVFIFIVLVLCIYCFCDKKKKGSKASK